VLLAPTLFVLAGNGYEQHSPSWLHDWGSISWNGLFILLRLPN